MSRLKSEVSVHVAHVMVVPTIHYKLIHLFLSDLKGQIDSLACECTSNAHTLSSEQKLSLLRQIQQSYGKCKEFGDDKVQLAMQTYEMVSKTLGWLQ